jgi:hypothetical protein
MMKLATAKRRWMVLICALMATLAAIAYPVDEELSVAPLERSFERAAIQPMAAQVAPETATVDWVASDVDPFAMREWITPVASSPAIAPVDALEMAPVPAVPAGPPPLPYKFIGQMDTGTETMIYLGRGEQVHLAKVGDVLDGTYKVVNLTKTQIEFELLASSERQTLSIASRDAN